MAGVTYKWDTREVLEKLRQLRERGQSPAPAFRSFGEHLLGSHRARFTSQVSPDGRPWTPLSQAYRAHKRRNTDKILVLDGYLKGTLRYQASDDGLRFGSDRLYAAVHQFGARRGQFGKTSKGRPIPWGDIPARPHIGLSADDRERGLQIIADYLARQ